MMTAAWFMGLVPGLVATALSRPLATILLSPTPVTLRIGNLAQGLNAILFLMAGTTIGLLCKARHAARVRGIESRLNTLADLIPQQLVWMAHADGSRFWFNKRWYEYTGTTLDQMAGLGWLTVCDPSEQFKVHESWQAAVAKGQPWEEIMSLRRHDGQLCRHLARAAPLRNSRGDIVRWFGTNTDISERMGIERTLQDADHHSNEFLATVAHELRNPLSTLDHSLTLWPLVDDDKTEMEELRAVMTQQIKQMRRLIEDLLDEARIRHGKMSIVASPLELNGVLSGALDAVRPLIDSCRQELTVNMSTEPLFVNGDSDRLMQVFVNLLQNATKFTENFGRIRLEAKRVNKMAVVTIRDNGCGLSADALAKIFEPRWQASHPRDRLNGRPWNRVVSCQAVGRTARRNCRGVQRWPRKRDQIHRKPSSDSHGRVTRNGRTYTSY